MSARGEPAVWITGGALVLGLAMIVAILAIIGYRGGRAFWPGRIDRVTLSDGGVFLGVPLGEEAIPGVDGVRRRYRVGNRDLGQESFRWVDEAEIASVERPESAMLFERSDWGVFLGEIEALIEVDGDEQRVLGEGDAARASFDEVYPEAIGRRRAIERLNDRAIPSVQEQLTRTEWRRRAARLEHERTIAGEREPLPVWVWGGVLIGFVFFVWLSFRTKHNPLASDRGSFARVRARFVRAGLVCALIGLGLVGVLEHPWSGAGMTAARLVRVEAKLDGEAAEVRGRLDGLFGQLDALRAEDERFRVVIREPTGGLFAPVSQSRAGEPMLVSQVLRAVEANTLSFGDRVGVYLSRWKSYLTDKPRSNGADGGIWPVIVGTVVLTLLLTVSVMPLGVIAALYLREYAHQGFVTSLLRIAINNLAGVPSIVYGMFGLGFFCYAVGDFVDAGPAMAAGRGVWWSGLVGVLALVVCGAVAAMLAVRPPTGRVKASQRVAQFACWVLWGGAIVWAGWLVSTTPYFSGWFEAKLPERPTFGGRGILWASLTLALLTLPVVIVAAEEAISAVPRSMREGSLATGASRWQTLRRIVLPSAMPGIMTGAILSMARGAGEVAPLMLVGAVNYAPSLPVSGAAPFLHGDRTFMHLGFHIYSLGFQSPDAEATEPLVWTTTLVLIAIVLALNLVAMVLRVRLRRSLSGAAI